MAAKKELSLTDLEKIIADRQTQVEKLLKKRDELQDKVDGLDAEIQGFLTPGGPRRKGRKRPKNDAPLRTVVLNILTKNRKGLSLQDVTKQVQGTGYKSQSNNLKNVVYQCLYNTKAVVHDRATGLYRVKR